MESRLDVVCFNFLLLLLPLGVNIGRGWVLEANYIPTICIIIIFCLDETRYRRKTGIYHYCWDNWSSLAPWAKSRRSWSALNIINYGMTSLISQNIWIGIFRDIIHLAFIPMMPPLKSYWVASLWQVEGCFWMDEQRILGVYIPSKVTQGIKIIPAAQLKQAGLYVGQQWYMGSPWLMTVMEPSPHGHKS